MIKFLFISICFFICTMVSSQTDPILPNTSSIETCMPDLSNYTLITVGPPPNDYSDLQLAINNSLPGSVLVLQAGFSFK
ncbi:MAG TPA: hypothetical protein VK590_13320, partial [Saprospiraceae bacterium]|nr:hypothetical protein [Saprospiraceae bacterium]